MTAPIAKPKPSLAAAILIPLLIWILFSIGAGYMAFRGFQDYTSAIDGFARIEPGTPTEVTLKSSGEYRVWAEFPQSESGVTPIASGITVTVVDADGNEVAVDDYVGTLSYSDGDREGVAVSTFSIDEPGDHTITATVDAFANQPDRLAIGTANPLTEIGKGVLLMVVVGTVGFLIALILFIVMLVRRGRSKRALAPAYAPGYPAPAYGAPGGYPPPQPGYPPQGYGAPAAYPPPPPAGTPPPSGPFGSPPGTPPPSDTSPPGNWPPPPTA